jgi:hypothetical protein
MKRKVTSIDQAEWDEVLEKFKRKASGFKSVLSLSKAINLHHITVKKILSGKRPNFINQIRVREFVKGIS